MTSPVRSRQMGAIGDLIGLQLRIAQLHFFAGYFREFGEIGISPAEHAVLSLLAEHAGIRQGELGDILRIKRSNMTKIMRALEKRGLTWRVAPETDGRVFEVRLTEKGRSLQQQLADKVFENDRYCASALSAREQADLLRLLKKLNSRQERASLQPDGEETTLHG